jgi:hypothetical protein
LIFSPKTPTTENATCKYHRAVNFHLQFDASGYSRANPRHQESEKWSSGGDSYVPRKILVSLIDYLKANDIVKKDQIFQARMLLPGRKAGDIELCPYISPSHAATLHRDRKP